MFCSYDCPTMSRIDLSDEQPENAFREREKCGDDLHYVIRNLLHCNLLQYCAVFLAGREPKE